MSAIERKKRILVVDDEADVRALLRCVFEGAAYAVDEAATGLAALKAIDACLPDLITLDLAMPGMTGFEFLQYVRALPGAPPIVAISGQHASPRVLASLHAHVWAYLSKPFPVDFLLQTCARILAAVECEPVPVAPERRRGPRRPLFIGAVLLSAKGESISSGQVLNLSAHGAQVNLGVPLAVNSRIRLALALPDGAGPLTLDCLVRWREGPLIGVSYVDLTIESSQRLQAFLE
jgi:CheY-like chemotaxis protein